MAGLGADPELAPQEVARPVASTTQRAVTVFVRRLRALSVTSCREPASERDVVDPPAAERVGAALERAVEELVLETPRSIWWV